MVEHHGSQCGFCTPGIVMSLFALYHEGDAPGDARQAVNDALAGNLCRCTGYRPIVDAALDACAGGREDRFAERARGDRGALHGARRRRGRASSATTTRFFAAPASDRRAGRPLCASIPTRRSSPAHRCRPVDHQAAARPAEDHLARPGRAGSTRSRRDGQTRCRIGATVTPRARRAAARRASTRTSASCMRRFGSEQVRASGTVGGNIANGSPIGDLPPALIALGATLELRRGDDSALVAAGGFLPRLRQAGPRARRVRRPRRRRRSCEPDEVFRCYKVSKRFDQDISAVMGAFRLTVDGRRIAAARDRLRRHGGDAEARAPATEARSSGAPLDDAAAWAAGARRRSARTFSPLDDMRASAAYRLDVARSARCAKALTEVARRAAIARPTRARRPREEARRCDMSRLPRPDRRRSAGCATCAGRSPHDSRRASMCRARRRYIDDIREPDGHAARRARRLAAMARGRGSRARPRRPCAPRPASSRCSPPATFRAATTLARSLRRRPLFAEDAIVFHGQVLFAVVADDARRGAARRAARARSRSRRRRRASPSRTRWRADRDGAARLRVRPRRCRERRIAGGAAPARPARFASAARSISTSKARSRWRCPGEDGDMHVHSSTQHPTEVQHVVARVLGMPDDAVTCEVPAHGRRLRRQGEPGQRNGPRIAALAARRHRAAVQAPARPRRRHGDDRQAPRFPRRLRRSASTRRAGSAATTSTYSARCGCSADLSPGRRRPHACSTPTTPISCRTCAIRSPAAEDQHGLEHRLPRLRRPAGHARRSSA